MSKTPSPGQWSPIRTTIRAVATVPVFMVRHAIRSRHVDRHESHVDRLSEAPPAPKNHPNLQHRDSGVGPIIMRTYEVDIVDPVLQAADLMSDFRTDPNQFNSSLVAGFVHDDSPARNLSVDSELVVELPGPWNGPCAIDHIDTTTVLMATLDGHMEAGHIRFRTVDTNDGYTFQIRSWARAGDAGFAAIHLGIPIGKELQTAMWCAMCERAVKVSGGTRRGSIRVSTEQLKPSDS